MPGGHTGRVLPPPVRVCFVCSGNICRSPTAEVVLNRQAAEAGLSGLVVADSAGTGSWHEGDDMDERSGATMEGAGYAVALARGEAVREQRLRDPRLVITLDSGHQNVLWWLAVETPDVAAARAKTIPLRHFDPKLAPGEKPDVADPYYGEGGGFSEVLAQVERSCAELLRAIERGIAQAPARLGVQQVDKPPPVALHERLDAVEPGRAAGAEGFGSADLVEHRGRRFVEIGGRQR